MGIYFSQEELCRSQVAASRGISNMPTIQIKQKLDILINKLLDPIRGKWGRPIIVNSGYRSLELNACVGGVATSQHTKGEAADITTGSKQGNKELFDLIINCGFEFDQLIDERNYTWLHVSYRDGGNRSQVLHLK